MAPDLCAHRVAALEPLVEFRQLSEIPHHLHNVRHIADAANLLLKIREERQAVVRIIWSERKSLDLLRIGEDQV